MWLCLYAYYSCCFVSVTSLNLDHFIQPLIFIVFSKITPNTVIYRETLKSVYVPFK